MPAKSPNSKTPLAPGQTAIFPEAMMVGIEESENTKVILYSYRDQSANQRITPFSFKKNYSELNQAQKAAYDSFVTMIKDLAEAQP